MVVVCGVLITLQAAQSMIKAIVVLICRSASKLLVHEHGKKEKVPLERQIMRNETRKRLIAFIEEEENEERYMKVESGLR